MRERSDGGAVAAREVVMGVSSPLFNSDQQRCILATFEHVEQLLAEAAGRLGAPARPRLFAPTTLDATARQRQIIDDYLDRLRQCMATFLTAHALGRAEAPPGGLWSLRGAVEYAQIALAALAPENLAGFGPLGAAARLEVERLAADLGAILQQLADFLVRGESLSERLARLDRMPGDGELLRELERVIVAQGLGELRSTLEWLVDRCARQRLEVGFFGRANAGKSSLLNVLLGQPVLPTGVFTSAAVPIRIERGAAPRVVIVDHDGARRELAPDRWSAQSLSPLARVCIEWPAPRLPEGVCWVETPALRSQASPASTLAYLPRCDIGVLLFNAAGGLPEDDLVIARALSEAGCLVLPVVSKSDLLSPGDGDELCAQLQQRLRRVGIERRLRLISAARADVALRWFDDELAPLLAQQRALRETALHRKVALLREAVVTALRLRLRGRRAAAPWPDQDHGAALSEGRVILQRSRRRVEALNGRWPALADTALEAAAQALMGSWTQLERPVRADEDAVARAFETEIDDLDRAVEAELELCRAALIEQLGLAAVAGATDPSLLPPLSGRPFFLAAPLVSGLWLRRGALSFFGYRLRRAQARRQVRQYLAAALRAALSQHAVAIRRWALQQLDALTSAFEAAAATGALLSRLRAAAPPPLSAAGARSLRADLERLQQWQDRHSHAG